VEAAIAPPSITLFGNAARPPLGLVNGLVIGHFESDECGGMERFVTDSPGSVLIASEVGAAVNLAHWNYKGPVKGMHISQPLGIEHLGYGGAD
jgi:hypothetical protein